MKKKQTLIGLVLVVGLIVPGTVVFAATSDYVNYWAMDEGTGRSVNDSVGGQNGVMTGTSTGFGWASGKVGTAVGMDGTTGTGIVLPNGFLKGSQGTIALWLNAQTLTDHNIIFSGKSTTDNNVYATFLIDRDGRPMLQFRDSTTGNDRKAQAAKLLNKNEWYNVVFTANAQTYHVYVNGEEITVAGDNIGRWFPDITNQTFMYRIGMLDATPLSGSWNGYLDDLRIYSRALALQEVVDLYTTTNAAHMTIPAGVATKANLTISEDHVPFGGSVNVMWSSVNANSCSLSGDASATSTSGSKVFIKLAGDTSYTLTCTGKYGSDTSSVNVVVGSTTASTSSSNMSVTMIPPVVTAPSTVAMTALYTRNLTVGSRGDDVKQLQAFLISKGFLGGSPTGYFGAFTKAAVIKMQKERGLPATGYFGAMSRASLNIGN